ncbi:Vacuolar inheritance and morphology protein [Rhizina undulata]
MVSTPPRAGVDNSNNNKGPAPGGVAGGSGGGDKATVPGPRETACNVANNRGASGGGNSNSGSAAGSSSTIPPSSALHPPSSNNSISISSPAKRNPSPAPKDPTAAPASAAPAPAAPVPTANTHNSSLLNPHSTSSTTSTVAKSRPSPSSREPSPSRSASQPHIAAESPSSSHTDSRTRSNRPLQNSPHWPTSPRLAHSRSPVPPHSKKSEYSTTGTFAAPPLPPSILLLREEEGVASGHPEPEDPNLPSGMRTPRSNPSPALETVIESSSPPGGPSIGATISLAEQVAALVARQPNKNSEEIEREGRSNGKAVAKSRAGSIASSIATQSESESGYKSDERTSASSSTIRAGPSSKSYRRPTVMGAADNSSRSMTVETETVSSIPQVAVGAVGGAGGASIRSKKSTDTIRPKKEKKRVTKRSAPSAAVNTSSKADIFAIRIAEAVAEANSSDSGETFVYESNPPEVAVRPTSRFHSRTPSATSIQGGPDPRGQRLPLLATMDGSQSTARKGMKFVNNSINANNMGNDGMQGDGAGSERGSNVALPGTVVGSSSSKGDGHAHQPSREKNGYSKHNGHRSILTDDSPFSNSSQKTSTRSLRHTTMSHVSSRHSSRATSPQRGAPFRSSGNGYGSKRNRNWVPYEADMEGADDERVPLMNPRPSNRRHLRRGAGNGSLRQYGYNDYRRGCWSTYAGCIIVIFTIILIMTGIGGFLFATTKALQGVRVLKVTDVLVSKQEIMLDLVVEATNPNVIAVTVGSMDVNLFAKSSHVRDGKGKDGGNDDDSNGDNEEESSSWWNIGRKKKADLRRKATELSKVSSQPEAGELLLGSITIALKSAAHTKPVLSQIGTDDNVDEGTDPPTDIPETDRQTMLLGRIFSFDSALTFDGSPFRHLPSESTGELRLGKPGNKTEEGGTERWERVLQHPFELIVRGVLKYQLPLSGRVRTAPIAASVLVHPDGTAEKPVVEIGS